MVTTMVLQYIAADGAKDNKPRAEALLAEARELVSRILGVEVIVHMWAIDQRVSVRDTYLLMTATVYKRDKPPLHDVEQMVQLKLATMIPRTQTVRHVMTRLDQDDATRGVDPEPD